MTSIQLEQYLNEQVTENPVLELTPAQSDEHKPASSETYDWISSHDEQNRYLYQHLESRDNEFPEWNFHLQTAETLSEHLWNQLLTRSCPMEQEEALGLLSLVQSLEPARVGACSLEECLCLQLDRSGQLTPELKDFIQANLTQIAKNQLSVISRSGKIWGTFPLNAFFVKAAPSSQDGSSEDTSTVPEVQKALVALIEQEDKSKPYSDRILSELLAARGFSISRRTVTKYREALSIPGTSGRRKY